MESIPPITTGGNAGGERQNDAGPPSDAELRRRLGMTGRWWNDHRCLFAAAKYTLLVSRSDPANVGAVRWPCDRWACAGCRRQKLVAYGLWYARRLLAATGPLFRLGYGADEWGAMRQRLLRAGAEWVRVGEAGGQGMVFGAYPRGTRHRGTLKGAGAEELIPKLGRLLAKLRVPGDGEKVRLLDPSKGWRMPDPPAEWHLAGRLPTGEVDDITAAAKRLGLSHSSPNVRGRVSIRLTPEVGVDDLGIAAAGEYYGQRPRRPGEVVEDGGPDAT